MHFSCIFVLQLSHFLLFIILKRELLIFLLFLMISKLNLKSGLLCKSTNQLWVNNDIGNITLFEGNTVLVEFHVQLLHHIIGHVRFKIKYLMEEDSINEVSNVFLDLSGQKLIESSSTKMVHELVDLLSALWHSESEMNININVSIIFSWAFLNWSIVVNNVFSKKADYSFAHAVAPMSTWSHQRLFGTTFFLEYGIVSWYIEFKIETAAGVVSSDHAHNALIVSLGSACH